jgi:hypothetical protein
VARGCYRELLDAQWDLGSLPAESRELRQLIGATAAEWRVSWDPFVAQKFPIGADGRRRNPRLEQHRLRAEGIREVRRKASRLGVEARRRRDKLAPRAVQ